MSAVIEVEALRGLPPLIAILRGLRPEQATAVGAALWEAGLRIIEVPLNSPEPFQSIHVLTTQFPQALIGAGTVLDARQVQQAHAAGARLIVSPNFDPTVVQAACAHKMVCLPGVLTPSEAFAAIAAGAHGLKLFPAELIGPHGVKALRAVLPPAVPVFPVGGIEPASLQAYHEAGANGFGIGSAIFKPGMAPEAVHGAACSFMAAWTELAGHEAHQQGKATALSTDKGR